MTQPNQVPVRVRKSVLKLTVDEKVEYVIAVKKLKKTTAPGGDPAILSSPDPVAPGISVYDFYVQRHVDAMMHAVHESPWFLPWHRQFILDFENSLRLVGGYPGYLPYWDWAGDPPNAREKKSAVWADYFMGGDGALPFPPTHVADYAGDVTTGPFARGQWQLKVYEGNPPPWPHNLRRGMGRRPWAPALPTQSIVDDVLRRPEYDSPPWDRGSPYAESFRNALEGWTTPAGFYPAVPTGMHNLVHEWVGGSMSPMSSPNDPVFFLHHCNIDRIWAWWQARNPGQQYVPQITPPDDLQKPGDNKPPRERIGSKDPMWPWTAGGATVTPSDVWNHAGLGYRYDSELMISRVAGTGIRGNSGDGGPATSARLNFPSAVAATADGGFLIAEVQNHAVRKVAADGTITRVAGTGIRGNSGDGGPATSARLNFPSAVAATADGGFLIADTGGHVVRRVAADGIITRVAGLYGRPGRGGDGGPATSALLNFPSAVAATADGGFLLADTRNHVVRGVSADGIITRVAGKYGPADQPRDGGPATSAWLNYPTGVAAAADGGFLIADQGDQVMRKVSADGTISRVAGTYGVAGSGGDGGPATSATLSSPFGVAATANGGFLIADTSGQAVRSVSADGMISLAAGIYSTAGNSGDGDPATSATLSYPDAVAATADGGFLILDTNNHAVRKVGWASLS